MKCTLMEGDGTDKVRVVLEFDNDVELVRYHTLLGYNETIPDLVLRHGTSVHVPGLDRRGVANMLGEFFGHITECTYAAVRKRRQQPTT